MRTHIASKCNARLRAPDAAPFVIASREGYTDCEYGVMESYTHPALRDGIRCSTRHALPMATGGEREIG